MLCVAYLQAAIFRVPGHTTAQSYLPNLQSAALLDRLSIPKTFLHFRDRPPTILKMETTFASLSSLPAAETATWQARNAHVDVGHVLQGFFAFYAGVAGGTFDWKEGMVSPLEGGFVRRLREGEPGVETVNDVGRGTVGGVGVRRIQDTELSERWSYGWISVEGEEARLSQLAKWGKVGMVVRDPFELGKVGPLSIAHLSSVEQPVKLLLLTPFFPLSLSHRTAPKSSTRERRPVSRPSSRGPRG